MKPTPVKVLENPAATPIVILGVGGTGGYCLQQLSRLLWGLRAERERAKQTALAAGEAPRRRPQDKEPPLIPEVLLCDGDTVSEGNLMRQYFIPSDVGKKKAPVLAERYGGLYGLPFASHPDYLKDESHLRTLVPEGAVVVGCVDNAATRRILHEGLSRYDDVVYVDAGNSGVDLPPEGIEGLSRRDKARMRDSGWEGQVLCGVRKGGETVIPLPGDQIPDLVEDDGEPLPSEVPCGQVVVSNPQRHLTNVFAATVLTSYLTPLLSDGTILLRMSLFCARTGYLSPYPALDLIDAVAV